MNTSLARSALIVLVSVLSQTSLGGVSWYTVDPPTESPYYRVVTAESSQNFWLKDFDGGLHHFFEQRWISYPSPVPGGNTYRYLITGDQQIYSAVIDSAHGTNFFVYRDMQWRKYSTHSDVPVRNLWEFQPDSIIAFGDWGRLYKLRNREWRRIENPFSNHILTAFYDSEAGIYLGVRDEGLYLYDGKSFKQFPSHTQFSQDLSGIDKYRDRVYCYFSDGTIHPLVGDTLQPADTSIHRPGQTQMVFADYHKNICAVQNNRLFYFTHAEWRWVELPTYHQLRGVTITPDSTFIVTDEWGQIYVQAEDPRLFFIEQAAGYLVDGSYSEQTDGATFRDLNGDGRLDLFVINSGSRQRLRYFQQMPDGVFEDMTSLVPPIRHNQLKFISVGDMNRDGRYDLVTVERSANNILTRVYIQDGNRKFNSYYTKRFPFSRYDNCRDLDVVDWNGDGYVDIILTFYYSQGRHKGRLVILENDFFGRFQQTDSLTLARTAGWNRAALFTDLDAQGTADLLLSRFWARDILWNNPAKTWTTPMSACSLGISSNTSGILVCDLDLDGQPEVLRCSSDGGILITELAASGDSTTIIPVQNSVLELPGFNVLDVNAADYDNNGLEDLLVTGRMGSRPRVLLLIQTKKDVFRNVASEVGLESMDLSGVVTGDIDNDGDLDIFGYRKGANRLWVNQLNDGNYLQVQVQSSHLPGAPTGTTIRLFDAGFSGETTHLCGVYRVGSNDLKQGSNSSALIHFGVPFENQLDIAVRYPDGKQLTVSNISKGQRISVTEHSTIGRALSILPGKTITLLRDPNFYSMTLLIILAFVISYVGTLTGLRLFSWSGQFAVLILSLNLIAFFLLFILLKESGFLTGKGIPLGMILLGNVLPLGLSYHLSRRTKIQSAAQLKDTLLQRLLIFNHGEWAMSNINSLELLLKNLSIPGRNTKTVHKQLLIRAETFRSTVMTGLNEILELVEPIEEFHEQHESITHALDTIHGTLPTLEEDVDITSRYTMEQAGTAIVQLKKHIVALKRTVFSNYTTEATQVIADVLDSLSGYFDEHEVEVRRFRETEKRYPVLIPAFTLGEILDNCVRNAVRSQVASPDETKIIITVYDHSPKIHIDIQDFGSGVPKADWDRIFESGYSRFGGTGMGLYHSREALKKFGGRIFIKSSTQENGTIFTLSLNRGYEQ